MNVIKQIFIFLKMLCFGTERIGGWGGGGGIIQLSDECRVGIYVPCR